MTDQPSGFTDAAPEVAPVPEVAAPRPPALSALAGNRAIMILLLSQNLVAGVFIAIGQLTGHNELLGWGLLASGAVTLGLLYAILGPAMRAFTTSRRWRTPPNWGVALGALLLGLIASRGVLLFVTALWPGASKNLPQFSATGLNLIPLLLAAGLVIPFLEELAFRGLALPGYERARGATFAALAISAMFAFAHGLPAQVLAILPLAWLLARAVQHSGSWWTGVLVHAGNNTLAVLLASYVSGNDALSRLAQDPEKVPLSTGLIGLALTALCMVGATVWLRPRVGSEVPGPRGDGGPVWSGSLIVVLVLGLLGLLSGFAPQVLPTR